MPQNGRAWLPTLDETKIARPASDWRSKRIEAAQQAPVRGQVNVDDPLPFRGLDMPNRREGAEIAGIATSTSSRP